MGDLRLRDLRALLQFLRQMYAVQDRAALIAPWLAATPEDDPVRGNVLCRNKGGEFNSFLVRFAPFGIATLGCTLQPQRADSSTACRAGDGVDRARSAVCGSSGNL